MLIQPMEEIHKVYNFCASPKVVSEIIPLRFYVLGAGKNTVLVEREENNITISYQRLFPNLEGRILDIGEKFFLESTKAGDRLLFDAEEQRFIYDYNSKLTIDPFDNFSALPIKKVSYDIDSFICVSHKGLYKIYIQNSIPILAVIYQYIKDFIQVEEITRDGFDILSNLITARYKLPKFNAVEYGDETLRYVPIGKIRSEIDVKQTKRLSKAIIDFSERKNKKEVKYYPTEYSLSEIIAKGIPHVGDYTEVKVDTLVGKISYAAIIPKGVLEIHLINKEDEPYLRKYLAFGEHLEVRTY